MAYKAIELAQYVVKKCVTEKYPISNLQLQKIMYFLQVACLRERNQPAFNEKVEAWQYGPVIPEVYYKYGCYGSMPIISVGDSITPRAEDRCLFDPIIEERQKQSPWDLVDETHRDGGAWKRNYLGPGTRGVIPTEDIRTYG